MNSLPHIVTLLKEWLEMTRHESHAIQINRWGDAAKIQKNKAALQQHLLEAADRWRAENPLEAAASSFSIQIGRLIDLELRQSELIAVRKREVREKILLLEQALYDVHYSRASFAAASRAA